MTEALITDLGQIAALRVISRTSVMRYKGTKKPLPEIARELGVDAVAEGSVVREGNRVRITAQLIEARPDRHLWAHSYERDLTSVLALQGEVAQAIANEIQIKVTPQEQARLARARSVNPEAQDLLLRVCTSAIEEVRWAASRGLGRIASSEPSIISSKRVIQTPPTLRHRRH
jgi:hypothetical protein